MAGCLIGWLTFVYKSIVELTMLTQIFLILVCVCGCVCAPNGEKQNLMNICIIIITPSIRIDDSINYYFMHKLYVLQRNK